MTANTVTFAPVETLVCEYNVSQQLVKALLGYVARSQHLDVVLNNDCFCVRCHALSSKCGNFCLSTAVTFCGHHKLASFSSHGLSGSMSSVFRMLPPPRVC